MEPRELAKEAKRAAAQAAVAIDPSGMSTAAQKPSLTKPTAGALYDRFPKFVLGFFALSVCCTLLAQSWALGPALVSRSNEGPFLRMTEALSDWWNLVGFAGLGAETDVAAMMKKVKGGSVILLYLIGQAFKYEQAPSCAACRPVDGILIARWCVHSVLLTFVVAWWMFKDLETVGPEAF